MNDRYLYRAKHIHALPANKHLDGTWIEGYLCNENYINSPSLEGEFLIDPSTICQCTGLRDKNGKLIWENDIVSVNETLYVCRFDEENFEWEFQNREETIGICCFHSSDIEITGNAIDNPELLEVGE